MSDPTAAARLLTLAHELEQVLEQEFRALQDQKLEDFESLQPGKSELLAELSRLCPPAQDLQDQPQWAGLHDSLLRGRDAHRRNSVLIESSVIFQIRPSSSGDAIFVHRFSEASSRNQVERPTRMPRFPHLAMNSFKAGWTRTRQRAGLPQSC